MLSIKKKKKLINRTFFLKLIAINNIKVFNILYIAIISHSIFKLMYKQHKDSIFLILFNGIFFYDWRPVSLTQIPINTDFPIKKLSP